MTHRFSLLLLVCFGALFAACGGDATSDEAVSEGAPDTAAAELDAAADDLDTTPTPPDVPERGPSPSTAATLTFSDGSESEIRGDELDLFFDTLEADAAFSAGAFGPTGIPAEFQQSLLGDLVIGETVEYLLAARGLERSAASIADSRADLESFVVSLLPPGEDPGARFESLPYLEYLVTIESGLTTLGEALVADAPAGEVVEVPCSSHILLASEDEALEVIALLDDGGDFAELAMEFSTGPSGPAGGVLGCTDPNGFVAEFRDAIVGAPVGTIIGPVQTDFGFHVITVTEIEEQTVGPQDPAALAGDLIAAELVAVQVEVAPELGTWDPVSGQVLPPG